MMQSTISKNYSLVLNQVSSMVAGIDPDRLVWQPPGNPNHALWTLGHLACSAQAIGVELGLDPWLPDAWQGLFAQGSAPVANAGVYPGLDELQDAIGDAQGRLADRLQVLSHEDWIGPLPDVRYRDRFPSLGNAVVHILLAHTSFHAGQLSAWRRAVDGA